MRILFNHWFSTAYYFIENAKNAGHYVISTNERESCVYKTNSNEFYLEPVLNDEDYLQWALDFCDNHNIDIFFCKRHSNIISLHKNLFKCIVIVEDYDNIVKFESKLNTMEFFKKYNICNTPELYVVNNYDNFICKYSYLKNKYHEICMKLDIDEGGQSFKRIISRDFSYNDLFSSYISESLLLNTIKEKKNFENIILMPYLCGTEYSIDCLNTNNGLIAIPRYKLNNRITQINNDKKLIDIAKSFQQYSNLNSAYNIQFRNDGNGKLYLLEVNTRLSGGSWKNNIIGVDFIDLIIKKELGIDIDVEKIYNNFNIVNVSNIENMIILQ